MARGAFSPLRFFRQSSADLLRQYFESRGLLGELAVGWPDGLAPHRKPLAATIVDAPPERRPTGRHSATPGAHCHPVVTARPVKPGWPRCG